MGKMVLTANRVYYVELKMLYQRRASNVVSFDVFYYHKYKHTKDVLFKHLIQKKKGFLKINTVILLIYILKLKSTDNIEIITNSNISTNKQKYFTKKLK